MIDGRIRGHKTMSKTAAPIYQVKITLKHSKPPIWRRLLISSEPTLAQLHGIIQVAMGWYDSHLHVLRIHDQNYSIPIICLNWMHETAAG
jgi:hypothetical protein